MNFTKYSVLVEIKRPDTPIFRRARGGRAGTWDFSPEFVSAVSQTIEQKAEWAAFAQSGEHYSKSGNPLKTRAKNTKTILVIGSEKEFEETDAERDKNVKYDTFALFRQECRSIDILTFDELLERARFIARSE